MSMSPDKYEEWLTSKQHYIEQAEEGKLTFVKGRLIQRPEDLEIIRDAMIRARTGKVAIPDELKSVIKTVSKGTHLGDAITTFVLDYPTALRERTQGRTSFFRLYGGISIGKTQSTLRVMKHLLQLHSVALEALKGNIDKEKAHKMIRNTAEYVFSPYTGRHKIDWDKWTKDFMDGVAEYGKWSYAANITRGDANKAVNIHNVLSKVFAFNRAYVAKQGKSVDVKSAIKEGVGPVGILDDFLANTNLDEIANVKDFYDAVGDSDFPTALLVETENIQSEVSEAMNKTLNKTEGARDRSGIGLTVDSKASEDVAELARQNMAQMSDDLFDAVLLSKLHTAMYDDNEIRKKDAYSELDNALALGGQKDTSKRLQDIKSILEKITGGDKEKASKLLRTVANAAMDIIGEGGTVYSNMLKEINADSLISALMDNFAEAAASDELKSNPEELREYLDKLQKHIESIGIDGGRDFSRPRHTTKGIKKDEAIKNYLFSKYGSELGVEGDEEAAKKVEEKLSKPTGEDVTDMIKKRLKAHEKEVAEIVETSKKELEKKGGPLVTQLKEETDFKALVQSPGKGIDREIFNFPRVWENGKICQVAAKESDIQGLQAKEDEFIDLGEFGGEHVFLNEKALKGTRTYKLWQDLHQVATKYLGEKDGRAMMRELILTAHGPSFAAHALMSSLGLYEGSVAKSAEKMPFFESFGQIYDKGMTIKEKYDKKDYEQISDLLKSLAEHPDINKMSSGAAALQHELDNNLDKLINPDGTVNETANKALAGFEVLADMAGKDIKGLLSHVEELGLDRGAEKKLSTLLHNMSTLANSDKVELKEPDEKVKEALENRKKELCSDKSGKKIVEAAKTVPNIANHPVANLTSKLANKRAARLLSLAA